MKRIVATALALLALAAVWAPGAQSRDALRSPAALLPGTEAEGVVSVLVVDDLGRPLPHAQVRAYGALLDQASLRYLVSTGEVVVADAETDRLGLAVLRLGDAEHERYWTFEAAGLAPTAVVGPRPPDRVQLVRGRRLSARLVDHLGRPAPGRQVEYYLGTDLAPTLAIASTGPDGVFTFEHIDGRVHDVLSSRVRCRHSGICPTDEALSAQDIDGGTLEPADLVLAPSTHVRGLLASPDGSAVDSLIVTSAPVAVNGRLVHARPTAIGRFDLEGLPWGCPISVFSSEARALAAPAAWLRESEYEPASPLRILLPAKSGRHASPQLPEERRVIISVTGAGAIDIARHDGATAVLLDNMFETTPLDVQAAPNAQAAFTGSLSPGDYRVFFGSPFEAEWLQEGRIHVAPAGDRREPEQLELRLSDQVEVSVPGGEIPAGGRVFLCSSLGGTTEITDLVSELRARAKHVWVPKNAVSSIVLTGPHGSQIIPLEAGVPESPAARFESPRVNRFRLVGTSAGISDVSSPDGTRLTWTKSDGGNIVETRASGDLRLAVSETGGRTTIVRVSAPRPQAGSAVVPVRMPAPASLRVCNPDGEPAVGAQVAVRTGECEAQGRVGDAGTLDGLPLDQDSIVVVTMDGYFPMTTMASRAADGVMLTFPAGVAEVTVDSMGGPSRTFRVSLDGWLWTGTDGRFTLRGLTVGQHVVQIGARGCETLTTVLDVGPAGVSRLHVDLRAN